MNLKELIILVLESIEFNVFIGLHDCTRIALRCSEACSIADCTKDMASKICPDQCPEQGV